MKLPERFGSWKGFHNRLRKWAADGTWKGVFTNLLAQADAEGDLDRAVAGGVHARSAFARESYERRNTVERRINKIKQWRGLATRYDTTATICLAALPLADISVWSAR